MRSTRQSPASTFLPFKRAPGNAARRPELVPLPPVSAVRTKPSPECHLALRELARCAERRGLEPLALELFFSAARLELPGRIDVVRSQLEEIANESPQIEARFYRRAQRALGREHQP